MRLTVSEFRAFLGDPANLAGVALVAGCLAAVALIQPGPKQGPAPAPPATTPGALRDLATRIDLPAQARRLEAPLGIAGGAAAEAPPWFALVNAWYPRPDGREELDWCGGAMISERCLITAAHCVAESYGNAGAEGLYVTFAPDRRSPDPAAIAHFVATEVWLHAGYEGAETAYRNDLALVCLPEPVPPARIAPPQDPERARLKPGDCVTVAGFGKTEEGALSSVYKQARMTVSEVRAPIIELSPGDGRFLQGDSGGPATRCDDPDTIVGHNSHIAGDAGYLIPATASLPWAEQVMEAMR